MQLVVDAAKCISWVSIQLISLASRDSIMEFWL